MARRCWILVLAAALLGFAPRAAADAPCALPGASVLAGDSGSGLGGTGWSEGSGLGGTGRGEEGGIGGTGVLGTLTGFGSVCVNGLRIGYDTGAIVILRGESGRLEDLAPGQVLWLLASARDAGLWTDRIEIVSAVLGRIDAVDASRGLLWVADREVEVPDGTPIVSSGDGAGLELGDLAAGQFLDVAGLPAADGHLVASRIVRHATALAGRARLAEIRAGLGQGRGFARLSVEGYAGAAVGPSGLALSGIAVVLPETLPDRARPPRGARLIVEGPIADGALRATRVTLRPERGERMQPPRELPPRGVPGAPRPPRPPSPPERPGSAEVPAVEKRLAPPERFERPEPPERPERPEVDRPDRVERPAADVAGPRSSF